MFRLINNSWNFAESESAPKEHAYMLVKTPKSHKKTSHTDTQAEREGNNGGVNHGKDTVVTPLRYFNQVLLLQKSNENHFVYDAKNVLFCFFFR